MVITSLPDVAVQVGANRILRLRQATFHCPVGVPGLAPEREHRWRVEAVGAALQLLQTSVEQPTVVEY